MVIHLTTIGMNTNTCINCAKRDIAFPIKQVCSPCYYKLRWERDKDKVREKNRKHYYKVREKEYLPGYRKKTVTKSRKIRNAERLYAIAMATPKWLSKEEFIELDNGEKGLTKDHIIPLIHKEVCGLNVPWNIQWLTLKENMVKKNSFDFTHENKSWTKRLK